MLLFLGPIHSMTCKGGIMSLTRNSFSNVSNAHYIYMTMCMCVNSVKQIQLHIKREESWKLVYRKFFSLFFFKLFFQL